MKGIAVLLMFFCFPPLVIADDVYQWVDDRGVTHFTDNPAAVPENYRSEAESREMLGTEAGPSLTELTDEEAEGILIEDDFKEKDEEWWRNRAEKWRTRLQAGYDEYERVRLRYNATATESNALKDPEKQKELKAELDKMQIEMKRSMADIDKARKMIEEVLPSQAKKAGKPLEWVR